MLRELRVRNFAVIEDAAVSFAPGLNVLTGETGAGKSLVIDAILLVRGGRAQTDVIRTGADSAIIEAVFDLDADGPAAAVVDEAGLATDDGQLVIRRELGRSGRHRAFVNDSAVTVGLLERLGARLVDVHGQHEHQRLLEPSRQLDLLDRAADTEGLAEQVAELVGKYRAAGDELARSRTAERDRVQREDLLRFQISELDAARIRAGEEEELKAEQRRLRHAERFMSALSQAGELVADAPESATSQLGRALRLLGDLRLLEPTFAAPVEALEAAQAHVEDALGAMRSLRDSLVCEPGRLAAIEERLDALVRLRRKYGDSEEAMLAYRDDAARELERLSRHEQLLAEQERLLTELGAELAIAAGTLSDRRRAAATPLAARVQREVRALGMERARFEIAIERQPPESLSPRGLDRVEFRLSTNPGEESRALARIVSGGELSRTMLALNTVLAPDQVPTMIFDEVDAGIGGRIAGVLAEKLADVARARQVLCVTHLAHIAARAHQHVQVTKTVRGGRARVMANVLPVEDRVPELARMLAGSTVTETALRHARELLATSGRR